MTSRAPLSARVAAELEAQITRGRLAPGTQLPSEIDLAERLDVSRTVVRDAVRTLAARGLVSIEHGHGTVVTEVSDATLADATLLLLIRSGVSLGEVVSARSTVETWLGPVAARRRQPEDCEAMANHLHLFERAIDCRDWREAHRAHLDFHLALLEAVREPALQLILKPLQEIILLSSLPPDVEDPAMWELEAHLPILTAVRARDDVAARAALESHFAFTVDDRYRDMYSKTLTELPHADDLLFRFRSSVRKPSTADDRPPGISEGSFDRLS